MEVEKTLHEVAAGVFAYTQLPGSWGWSNAGLIVDGDQSLLVDTLFDRRITREMLAAMRRATPAARRIGTVVNTHGNGDHCYGNGEVPGAEIIGSRGCVEDLSSAPPSRNATLMRAARVVQALGGAGRVAGRVCNALGLNTVAWLVEATPLALPLFETFEFSGNDVVLPTRIFVDRLSLRVGDRRVELMELGPAHTLGDTVVHLPDERVLFTGDLLTDLSGIRETLGYLEWLTAEARARYDAGLTVEQAAREISLEAFRTWLDAERVFVNVHSLYRDFAGDPNPAEILELFAGMARLAREGAHGCH
jgi:glyoxylase-like metal-dependent hydrolase (beta-lactamase superfamily II)